MFSFLVATTVAVSSVSLDGIFNKKGSCSGGSCSATVDVVAKPAAAEKKIEAKTSCSDSCSGKNHKHFKLFASRRGCKR